jgi:hypothetical protein
MCRVVACTVLVLVASTMGPNSVAAQGPPGPTAVIIQAPLPLPVTDADNPGRSPFQATLCRAFGDQSCDNLAPETLTVSSEVRLVIEFVSSACTVVGSTDPRVTDISLDTTVATTQVRHHFIPVPTDVATGLGVTVSSQSTKIYADPGTVINLGFSTIGPTSARCFLSISGYTIAP